ncbi:AraC family transcriptional regulator [Lactiplantibacillus carotarum]|uniref:AraC family transcriptional regulator n=1 Tax=Lactiplantibacillus carotarum TaxID=2993456 RepID=UPI00298F1A83|nr:AraC family ligand binding domain-containing protein [Lactiplantibacillus carotarum]
MTYFYSDFGRQINKDLHCYTCGEQECEPGHNYGPTVRKGYIIYLITAGSGLYEVRGKSYHLSAGQGFMVLPGEICRVTADTKHPWTYQWVGFLGDLSKQYFEQTAISVTNPTFQFKETGKLFSALRGAVDASQIVEDRNLILTSAIYKFLFQFCQDFPAKPNANSALSRTIIENSLYFIHTNFGKELRVDELADFVHTHRTQLYKLFKRYLDISPQEYIINYRIARAKDLLASTTWPIGTVASSVGYSNPFLFSKTFKERVHETPSAYRKNHHTLATV